jgi:hypothetical protein
MQISKNKTYFVIADSGNGACFSVCTQAQLDEYLKDGLTVLDDPYVLHYLTHFPENSILILYGSTVYVPTTKV